MKAKKRGFTLIEIIGAVTILGIFSVIAIISVSRVIQRAKAQHYKTAEENLEMAGQSYTQQNRDALPKIVGQKENIYLNELIKNNIIKPIKDYNNKICDASTSYVQVYKYSQTEYSYIPYLDCKDAYQSIKITSEKLSPRILVRFNKIKNSYVANIFIDHEDDSKIKLMSYSYIIYKDDKEIKNSGNIELPNHDTKKNKSIDITEFVSDNTNLKISVSATNIYGNSTTVTTSHKYTDETKPECIYINNEDKPDSTRDWTNQERKITIRCDDGDGSGCTKKSYSKTFTDLVKIGTITIQDKAGNKQECNVAAYVDQEAPTITSIVNSSREGTEYKWIGGADAKIVISVNATDAKPDAKSDDNSGMKKIYYKYEENATEYTDWDLLKSVDYVSGTWTQERNKQVYVYAVDNAGNVSEKYDAGWIKIDKTPPSIENIKNEYNGIWTNKNYPIILEGKDVQKDGSRGSGIKKWRYSYEDLSPTSTAWINYPSSAQTEYQTSDFSVERDQNVYISVCDNAGNCSENSTSRIKIDNTKPIIKNTTNNSNSNWVNRNVTITATVDNPKSAATNTGSDLADIYYIYGGESEKHNDWNGWRNADGSINIPNPIPTSVTGEWEKERESLVWVYAKDQAGNISEPKFAGYVRIDKTPPQTPYVFNWQMVTPDKCENLAVSCTYNSFQNKSNRCDIRFNAIAGEGTCIIQWNSHIAEDRGTVSSGNSYIEYKWAGNNCVQNSWTQNDATCLSPLDKYTKYIRVCDKAGNCSNELKIQVNPQD